MGRLTGIQRAKAFAEGRNLWHEYVQLNGYSFEPNDKGLKKLSTHLGLKVSYLRKTIHGFLGPDSL